MLDRVATHLSRDKKMDSEHTRQSGTGGGHLACREFFGVETSTAFVPLIFRKKGLIS